MVSPKSNFVLQDLSSTLDQLVQPNSFFALSKDNNVFLKRMKYF